MCKRAIPFVVLLLVAFAASPGEAQYFGRNKVQYETFDFHILETPHFDLFYYETEHDAAVDAGRLAERWYERLSRLFGHTFDERQPIVMYASHTHFAQTTIIPGFLGEGTGGVTEHLKGRVVLPFAVGLGETDHVLGHELVHAFQRDILREQGRAMSALPLWFLEGMAEYVSLGGIDANTEMWLRDAVNESALPRIDQLDDPKWFPYRYGQSLWTYLADRFGESIVAKALTTKAPGGAFGRLTAVSQKNLRALSEDWQASIRQQVKDEDGLAEHIGPATAATSRPGDSTPTSSRVLVAGDQRGGRLNVAPAISPDGRELIFASERDQHSVDLFLADAQTGAVTRKLVGTAIDPHFESLEFIDSAGAWDPTGQRYVFAAVSRGQPVLTIIDAHSGAVERELRLAQFDDMFSPTWSPDGRSLAFSAMQGGFTDLYRFDLATSALTRMTHDAFSDLQPSWSPDGHTIVFATDRFSSSLNELGFGDYQLAVLDLDTQRITALPLFERGKHINPQWSNDGASVYFVADPNGTSNIYQVTVASGELVQITDVSTGVSGITALSPAVSASRGSTRVAYTMYRRGSYQIYTMDAPMESRELVKRPPAVRTERLLPTTASSSSAVDLADDRTFSTRPYRSALSFSGVAQPYLTAGGGDTGSFLRAGVALTFGDMLGLQELQTVTQVGGSVDDFSVRAAYVNRHARWNWGVVGSQAPWFTREAPTAFVAVAGAANALSRRADLVRQIDRQITGVTVYPFSGAKRVELSMGGSLIGAERTTTTGTYSSITGQLLNEVSSTVQAGATMRLFETGAAFVSDTALFGPTSPILGERYRLAISATNGSLNFSTITADYRKYMIPIRPLTIAVRAMHVGRYGVDAADPRLLPLTWTLRGAVRGYGDEGPVGVPALTASRLSVANVEARIPLLPFLAPTPRATVVPIEGFVFSDAGAFSINNGASPRTRENAVLQSAGAGVRLSVAGLMFEFSGVRPFSSNRPGWTLAFNVQPGF